MDTFDTRRATLSKKDMFKPFRVSRTEALADRLNSGVISPGIPVLQVERHDERLIFLTQQMNYHHLAQGELAGEPYLVSF